MMAQYTNIKALFLDIGGVFLTNGWDTQARREAAIEFSLDFEELNDRHRIIFDAYEAGKSSLEEYLHLLIFYKPRSFTEQDVRGFMMRKSHAYADMIQLVSDIKHRYALRTIAVNNEGRELNEYRVEKFNLKSFIDVFASSCYVHMRKPDKEIYHLSLDLVQAKPSEVIYLDDRAVFVEAANALGIHGIQHRTLEETRAALSGFGLT